MLFNHQTPDKKCEAKFRFHGQALSAIGGNKRAWVTFKDVIVYRKSSINFVLSWGRGGIYHEGQL